jgi:hypothetical protein
LIAVRKAQIVTNSGLTRLGRVAKASIVVGSAKFATNAEFAWIGRYEGKCRLELGKSVLEGIVGVGGERAVGMGMEGGESEGVGRWRICWCGYI